MVRKNRYYILDDVGFLNIKEYDSIIVKVVKKVGWNRYLCAPVEPVIYPISEEGYACKCIIVGSESLRPYHKEDKIVVRYPYNFPSFSKKDINCIDKLIDTIENGGNILAEDIKQLKAISLKMRYTVGLKGNKGRNSNE